MERLVSFKLTQKRFFLLSMLLLALLVRIWGIRFGLPYLYQVDERKILYTVLYSASHQLRPDTFIHSTLIAYLFLPVFGLYYLVGASLGIFSSPFSFLVSYIADPTTLVFLSRMMMALISAGVVLVVYLIGKLIINERVGLIASLFSGFNFLLVKESHYVKDEVLATLFITLFVFFCLKVLDRGKFSDYIWSGLFLGLSVSAKYIYAPIGLVFVFAHLLRKDRHQSLYWGLLTALVVFFVTNPYFLIDFSRFYGQTMGIFLNQRGVGTSSVGGRSVWMSFLEVHLPQGFGWPVYLVSVFGFLASVLGYFGEKGRLIGVAAISIFGGIVFGGGNFARWAVPLVPIGSILGGLFLDRLKIGRIAFGFVVFAILLPSLLRIVKFNNILTWSDTRSVAKDWIENNLTPGSSIAIEGAGRDEIPSYLGPSLVLEKERIQELVNQGEVGGEGGLINMAMLQASDGSVGYDLVGVPMLSMSYDQIQDCYVELDDVESYVDRGVEYLVRSSWVEQIESGQTAHFNKTLEQSYVILKTFKPTVQFSSDVYAWDTDYEALDSVPFFGRGTFGPEISIYRLRESR